MATYNQWMNSRLYELCWSLPREELEKDRSAFFGSIYLTLNHITYGDLAFMSRFTGEPPVVPEINQVLYPDFSSLHQNRIKLDERLVIWAESLTESWLSESITYKSKVDGKTRTASRWVLVVHMFNHQTHHRGQVTTLLSQIGHDIGSTDIPFMPQFETTT